MAESSLTAAFRDLQADVGDFLGYGRGADFSDPAWTTRQQADITRSVKGGLRLFYYCGYDWSFLRPVATFTLDSGASVLPLPDDLGGVEGQIVLSSPSNTSWYPISFVPVGAVTQKQAELPNTTGRPVMACQESLKGTTGDASNRFQLRFWPAADQDYTLKFQYYVHPDYLSGAFPYAYGGPQHAECLLEACLAVAERVKDDVDPRGGASPHQVAFERLLSISKDIDRRNKPQTFGYNADRSDKLHRETWRHWNGQSVVTVDGVSP